MTPTLTATSSEQDKRTMNLTTLAELLRAMGHSEAAEIVVAYADAWNAEPTTTAGIDVKREI